MEEIYRDLVFPPPPPERPYVFLNMVATLDGKIVSGEAGEDVSDLGSKNDHALMRRVEAAAQGLMLGAGTIRATTDRWVPRTPIRIALTRSGMLDFGRGFFREAAKVWVAAPGERAFSVPAGVERLVSEPLSDLLRTLRARGIERLLCMGGSDLNGQLFREDLIDELFLTLAPKIKLGDGLPTLAGGAPLPREALRTFRLIECHPVEDEVFLRYRRAR